MVKSVQSALEYIVMDVLKLTGEIFQSGSCSRHAVIEKLSKVSFLQKWATHCRMNLHFNMFHSPSLIDGFATVPKNKIY